ncbi:hypothetical protein [Aeromonas molluscorum]|uniref:HD domain-containing protein n=1 Tax=Aeromonas molluscorum 848 TaxID=1268236 RepID=R1F907_9GAMM|nr:HD domain-containing protein [Aeromonas molluscorum 848]
MTSASPHPVITVSNLKPGMFVVGIISQRGEMEIARAGWSATSARLQPWWLAAC